MTRLPSEPIEGEAPSGSEPESGELQELRRLILGPVQRRLSSIEGRLQDPRSRATDVSEVLPEAVMLRGPNDNRLTTALMGSVEEIVRTSVRKNREVLAHALSPVVSLAVRKSVSEFFQRLLQSVNEALEVSWSWRGLKWRLEAFRTGKRFAEIVLLHTLDYRVEQVFLIHSENGLLIDHVAVEPAQAKEPELVSSMLKAIQDFTADSFSDHLENRLDIIAFGDLSIWIENGPEALLACAIRGNAPQQLREQFRAALDHIHEEKAEELAGFSGDSADFESIRRYLEECLVVQRKAPQSKVSVPLKVLLVSLGILLGVGIFWLARDWLRWNRYVDRLETEPGIVVLKAERNLAGFAINGLRDPLAADPAALLRDSGLDASSVTASWAPYFALDSRLVQARLRSILAPPSTVALRMDGSSLIVEGSAQHSWIAGLKQVGRMLPAVSEVKTSQLVDLDLAELKRLEAVLETEVIRFELGSATLTGPAARNLIQTADRIRSWFLSAERCGLQPRLTLVGHTDPSGGEAANRWLSQERARRVHTALTRAGMDGSRIAQVGVGTTDLVPGPKKERNERNRSVTLRLHTGSQQ